MPLFCIKETDVRLKRGLVSALCVLFPRRQCRHHKTHSLQQDARRTQAREYFGSHHCSYSLVEEDSREGLNISINHQ